MMLKMPINHARDEKIADRVGGNHLLTRQRHPTDAIGIEFHG